MNKTVIEVGALVFGILLLIGLYLAYSGQGGKFITLIENRITGLWNNNSDRSIDNQNGGNATILPINLEDTKVLFTSL